MAGFRYSEILRSWAIYYRGQGNWQVIYISDFSPIARIGRPPAWLPNDVVVNILQPTPLFSSAL